MMLPLNIPFIPDEGYLRFLLEHEDRLQAVHFSLHDPLLQDARIHTDNYSLQKLKELLGQLKRPAKYLLANGRIHPDIVYKKDNQLHALIHKLDVKQRAILPPNQRPMLPPWS